MRYCEKRLIYQTMCWGIDNFTFTPYNAQVLTSVISPFYSCARIPIQAHGLVPLEFVTFVFYGTVRVKAEVMTKTLFQLEVEHR